MASGALLQAFGKYVLVRKLAEGGMAEIFLAKQVGPEGFERNVVIKRMHPQLSSSPEFVEMFLDEARLAARLSHPNIVAINDLGQMENHYFIGMEYLSGEDLAAIIRQTRAAGGWIPLQVLARVFIDACEGLHFAHEYQIDGRSLGIVHRDISPSNLFVTYSGVTKVLDFGIAKAATHANQTAAGVVKGKFVYMSPEQASQGGPVDRRSDVWAVGASLFEGVTLNRLFQRDNDLAILKALCVEPVPRASSLRPDVPAQLDAIIARALERDMALRYQTCADLRADLETFAATLPPLVGAAGGYLNTLFGVDRVRERSTIPTLASLKRTAAPSTPLGSSATLPHVDSDLFAPPVNDSVPTTAGVPASFTRKKSSPLLLAVAALALVGLGGAGALLLRSPGPAVATVQSPQVAPAATQPTPVAVPAPTPAPVAPAVKPPEPPPAVASHASSKPPVRQRVLASLTTRDIQEHISARHAQILSCFQTGRSALTQDQGKVLITFTVQPSGRVTAARLDTPEVANTPIGSCITRQIRAIEFPRTRDRELTITVPFLYRVTR